MREEDGAIRVHFDPSDAADHRWTPERLHEHMNQWVRATGPRFVAQRAEIKARRRPYRAANLEWLYPPETDSPSGGNS